MKAKETDTWVDDQGYHFKGVVDYGINECGDFTIYMSVYRRKNGRGRWTLYSQLCSEAFLEEKFPELIELCQFNRMDSSTGERMHYYFLGWRNYCAARGWMKNDHPMRALTKEERLSAWNSFRYIVSLDLDGKEQLPRIQNMSVKEEKKFRKWLKSRLPMIHKKFLAAMEKFNLIE